MGLAKIKGNGLTEEDEEQWSRGQVFAEATEAELWLMEEDEGRWSRGKSVGEAAETEQQPQELAATSKPKKQRRSRSGQQGNEILGRHRQCPQESQ